MSQRSLPWSLEAEEGVLGSILIDAEALALVAERLSPQDFYRDAHRIAYEMMLSLESRSVPVDLITLYEELGRVGKLGQVGDASWLASLTAKVPTSGNVEYYADIVAEKALYRRLIHAAGEIAACAYEEDEQALSTAESLIFSIGQRQHSPEFSHIKDVIGACMEQLDQLHQRKTKITGVPTGFRHLDLPLGGLQPCDLIILAARPGTGKTALALNIAHHAASGGAYHVAFFSLEMSKKQLGMRLLALIAEVNQQRLRVGWVEDEEWERLLDTMQKLEQGSLWIDDTPALSLSALRSKALRLHSQQRLDLLIVDYLQLIRASTEKRSSTREQEIAEISRGLKALAKELQVPVLALAQLSRAVESRQSKIPQLSDLRESGAIENDADVVLFIYREELYNENPEVKGVADIIIAKHRNGPLGTVLLHFDAPHTRFLNLEVLPPSDKELDAH